VADTPASAGTRFSASRIAACFGCATAQIPVWYCLPIGEGDQTTLAASEVTRMSPTSRRRTATRPPSRAHDSTVARNTAASTIEL
jgi:hypothetical protein